MKTKIAAFLILLTWGLIKLPIETRLDETMERNRLGGFKLTADLRQRLGHGVIAALLGGMRGAIADIWWIRAHVAWTNAEYGRMKHLFDTSMALQPRREMFYEMACWHMAWNGGAFMSKSIKDPVERRREEEKYWKLGEAYGLQGVQNVPDSWTVWLQLGRLYEDKFKDYEKAAWAYTGAANCPKKLDYVKRFPAFMLAKIPGREKEAYDALLALYKESEDNWVPTLLLDLQRMEKFLNIPEDQRQKIDPDDLLPPGVPRSKPRKPKTEAPLAPSAP